MNCVFPDANLVIFIICPAVIFMDAYKQSQYHLDILVDLETRMSWVYRRTGTAMAITSATTCAAFLCTLITPLTSLQSFGIFAAVVIFIDYVLVMTLFCTAVIIYHDRFENSAVFGCCCPCGRVTPTNTDEARVALENSDGEIKRDRVSEFFKVQVAGFIKVPLHRLILCVMFLTWLGIAIWQASLIEATKENEQFLDEDVGFIVFSPICCGVLNLYLHLYTHNYTFDVTTTTAPSSKVHLHSRQAIPYCRR